MTGWIKQIRSIAVGLAILAISATLDSDIVGRADFASFDPLFTSFDPLFASVDPAYPTSDPSCSELAEIIARKAPASIDALLAYLSEQPRFKGWIRNYAFVYASKSRQKGTSMAPRTLVYGTDATMIMAFLGGPDSHGRDAIELSCWNVEKSGFNLYELDFAKSARLRLASATSQVCLDCHGRDPRPNMASYNFWPGFYGSMERNGCAVMRKDRPEGEYYAAFMAKGRHMGRYGYLPPETSRAVRTYGGRPCIDGPESPLIVAPNAVSTSPASDLLDRLTLLNSKRIVRLLRSSPKWEALKPAALAIINNGDFVGALPPLVGNERTFGAFVKEALVVIEDEHKARQEEFYRFNGDDPVEANGRKPYDFVWGLFHPGPKNAVRGDIRSVLRFFYLMERAGLGDERLTTGFDSGSYDMATGGLPDQAIPILRAALRPPTKGWIESLFGSPSRPTITQAVAPAVALAPTIVDEAPLALDERTRIFGILQTVCTECHGAGEVTLPLDSQVEFEAAVRASPAWASSMRNRILGVNLHGRPQMPLSRPFAIELQIKIARYLRQLEAGND